MNRSTALPARADRRRSPRLVVALVLCAIVTGSVSVSSHPPYEHLARTITDGQGREFRLFKAYVDGILFTDPVKLVIRDGDDRTVSETDYVRNVSVICWQARTCAVFQHDAFWSVLPKHVWHLDGGRLRAANSVPLVMLGIVVPLLDDAPGYLWALVTLGVPLLGMWLLWRSGPFAARWALLGAAIVAFSVYALAWLYAVALLSRLSLHLVLLVYVVAGAMLALTRAAALKAGVQSTTLARVRKGSGLVICALAGAGFLYVVTEIAIQGVRMNAYARSITFDEPPVEAPKQMCGSRASRVCRGRYTPL